MAVTGVVINDVVAGDDYPIKRPTITNVPAGETITKAWFTAKDDLSDADVAAVVQKVITTTLTAGQGHINDSGADGTAGLFFTLTPTDTRAIRTAQLAPATIEYDIQLLFSGTSGVYTLERGTISTIADVTLSLT